MSGGDGSHSVPLEVWKNDGVAVSVALALGGRLTWLRSVVAA